MAKVYESSDAVQDYIWVRVVHTFAGHPIKKPSTTSTVLVMPLIFHQTDGFS